MSRSHNPSNNGKYQEDHPYWAYYYWLEHGDRSWRDMRNRNYRHTENQRLKEGKILSQGDLVPKSRRCAYDWW